MTTENETVRRNVQGIKTREEVLKAAGKLFSQNGYGLTSIRDLAQESGAGLSTIIYHFKSKENLYLETIRHFALEMVQINALFEPLFAVSMDDPQKVSDTLCSTLQNFLNACHGPNKVEHLIGLYNRLIVEGNPEALKMLIDCFADVQRRLPEFFRRVRPDLDEMQIGFLQQLLWSMLQYTVVSKPLILYDMKMTDEFSEEYVAAAARTFAQYLCLPLGLPAPRN